MFLRLAGHPVRWRLLSELARSDRQVRELTELLGQKQSLVSYHLGQLRSARLVSMRRSSADGRDAYYKLDLMRCGELLAAAGGGLHPALRLAPPPACPVEPARTPARVLFLCTGNSARSQIAEGLLQAQAGGRAVACSAGSHPKRLHPNAVRVMSVRGIDLSGRRAKHLNAFIGQRFDHVISLCDRVREVCPDFPGHPNLIHWSIPDPALDGDTDDETYPSFERLAVDLETRIRFLLHVIDDRDDDGTVPTRGDGGA
ncbi:MULTISPECIES: ArsR family transcriptional regulator [unclassified Pseudofrankia]|uniref:arsenate reductase/protein-tyrosine-phosphatase family protein n=1 Tax=unclassified Pseudofrankia TaxID=2994372 RepID=UPI0008D9D37D|nr:MULTISPECIES: ArsR family transcriptional regulator [unclassified Pseudofrankia]MDT3443387.1 ArsR family transcriptional regulator [Pseudofrankia sp. BMG5.37]OHV64540.1 ArsR family transcriptional regulator [Pseudofrankia sp. BMG5.36]